MKEFVCPDCGNSMLEEIVTGAQVATLIKGINKDNRLDYNVPDIDEGRIDRYQCAQCGFTIKDQNDKVVKDPDELIAWFKKKQKTSLLSG